jgi:spoIIIJ-associated protein
MSAEAIDRISQITRDLITALGLVASAIDTTSQDDGFVVQLELSPSDSGILIGYHAETLNHFQLILSLIVHQQLKSWHRLTVNINDYRQNREATLTEMAHNAAERVRLTGREVVMPYLDSFERRFIHLALSQEADLETVSLGEGRDRRLVIRPSKSEPQS